MSKKLDITDIGNQQIWYLILCNFWPQVYQSLISEKDTEC